MIVYFKSLVQSHIEIMYIKATFLKKINFVLYLNVILVFVHPCIIVISRPKSKNLPSSLYGSFIYSNANKHLWLYFFPCYFYNTENYKKASKQVHYLETFIKLHLVDLPFMRFENEYLLSTIMIFYCLETIILWS